MKDKKVLILGVVTSVILLFTVGVTYAFFNYNRTGTNNSQLVAGDIYMHFKETNQLTIENAMPYSVSYSYKHNSNMTEEEVNACVTYFETSDEFGPGFIEYLIANGESIETFCDGTGTALDVTFQQWLDDNVFPEEYLTYFEENNIIKLSFPDLPYFEFTIDGKNTYTKEDIWYEIVLSHGDSHATRTERIKDILLKFRLVEVVDGKEQELFTNKSYSDLTNKRVWVDTIPKNTTNEVVHTYRLYMWIWDGVKIGNTTDADYDMEAWNNEVYASIKVNVTGDFNKKDISTDASCFGYNLIYNNDNYYKTKNYILNDSLTTEQVSACVSYLTSNWGAEEDNTEEGETYESFCRGTGTYYGDTFQQILDNGWFYEEDLTYFEKEDIIIGGDIVYINNDGLRLDLNDIDKSLVEIEITNYDNSCEKDVVIPSQIDGITVTKINSGFSDGEGSLTYSNFQGILTLELPNTIKSIGNGSFCHNSLIDLIIPDSVESISLGAFSYNNLRSIQLGNNLNSIESRAFYSNDIKEIIIPDSVTYLGNEVFTVNETSTIVIGDGITTLNNKQFDVSSGDLKAKSLKIGNGVETIEKEAFIDFNLVYLELGNSVTSIGDGAFRDNQLTSVMIPDSVTSIGDGAFRDNQLTSVMIPDSVTTIDNLAFQNNQLTSVVIPGSVVSIGAYAFLNNQLTSVTIENGVEEINNYAFINNNLTAVTIPDSVTYLGCEAFDDTVKITKSDNLTCQF